MGQATLVREQVDGGEKLLARLRDQGFHATGACWAKVDDDREVTLYVVVPGVDQAGVRPAYFQIRAALDSLAGEWSHVMERIDPLTVRVIGEAHPLARGVLEYYRNYPDQLPKWEGWMMFGSLSLESVYIYQPSLFLPPTPAVPSP